jgi:hypothetical protein
MSKFIIADLTGAKAVVQELQAIVPDFPSVAVRFIIQKSEKDPSMLDHIRRFPWVLDGAFEYENPAEVIESINNSILEPVEAKLKELIGQRPGIASFHVQTTSLGRNTDNFMPSIPESRDRSDRSGDETLRTGDQCKLQGITRSLYTSRWK